MPRCDLHINPSDLLARIPVPGAAYGRSSDWLFPFPTCPSLAPFYYTLAPPLAPLPAILFPYQSLPFPTGTCRPLCPGYSCVPSPLLRRHVTHRLWRSRNLRSPYYLRTRHQALGRKKCLPTREVVVMLTRLQADRELVSCAPPIITHRTRLRPLAAALRT